MNFDSQEHFTAWVERTKAGKHHSAAADMASERDRIWFEQHAGADRYVRRLIKGEFPPFTPNLLHATFVLVQQIKPGARTRIPMTAAIVHVLRKNGGV